MLMMTDDCRECIQPLVEIDDRRRHLTGLHDVQHLVVC